MPVVTSHQQLTAACPKCGQPLTTLWTEGDWQFYRCDTHGIIVQSPDDSIDTDEPDDSKIRR